MQAGKLLKYELRSPDGTLGTGSEPQDNYLLIGYVFGDLEPISGSEGLQAKQLTAEISHRGRFRYHAGIKSDMRLQRSGRIFDIVGPPLNIRNKNRELEISAIERTAP